MKTQIYKNYTEFLDREDKNLNGATQEFADQNPNYAEERGNDGCWNCSDCWRCSGCSGCSGCSDCWRCSGCSDCWRCSGCSDCWRCSGCSGCSGCSDCSGLKDARPVEAEENKSWFDVPTIPQIHSRILSATSAPNSLNMSTWHTCETTHCRAGWVVQLAGEKGKKLESASSTLFAAMQIYRASSPGIPVSPVRFFETNEVAMADIRRCAEEEAKLKAAKTPEV